MKFAHLADCHIGSWRDPKLRNISLDAFAAAVDQCIDEQVDFILISGDLFNNSLPSIDHLNVVVKKLKELKDRAIAVYAIEGSHDFSPSGKTIIRVLENAGLLAVVNGDCFTLDPKTNAKLLGISGKRGCLEKESFKELGLFELEKEEGFKIFMFHSAIEELKPAYLKDIPAIPFAAFPKSFGYYAGGHVHTVEHKNFADYPNVVFPGPLFPNSFSELEQLKCGGFFIFDNGNLRHEPIQIHPVFSIVINCNGQNPKEVEDSIKEELKNKEFINTIITIRLFGCLKTGKPSDISFSDIFRQAYDKSAYFVMRNTYKLTSKELEKAPVKIASVEEAEERFIADYSGKSQLFSQKTEIELTHNLINILGAEKEEGQTNTQFEEFITTNTDKLFDEAHKERR